MTKKSVKYWQTALIINTLLRIFGPLVVFLSAPAGALLSWLSDLLDGYIIFRLGWRFKKYLRFDKALDYWWYFIILIYSLRLTIFPTVLLLFLFRSIGQILSLLSANEKFLLFFPNGLEVFFVLYILSFHFFPGFLWFFSGPYQLPTIIFSLVFSLSQEYRIHVKKISYAKILFNLDLDWSLRK